MTDDRHSLLSELSRGSRISSMQGTSIVMSATHDIRLRGVSFITAISVEEVYAYITRRVM